MKQKLRTIFLTLFCLSMPIFAGPKMKSKKQNFPNQKQEEQSSLPSLVFADSFNVRLQELDSLQADCNETLVTQALNGDRMAYLRVLATMAIAPIFMRESTDALSQVTRIRDKLASQGDIDYAD